MNDNKVFFELTPEQTQLARLALCVAMRNAEVSLEKSTNITKTYEIRSLIEEYRAVERTMCEALKDMMRRKGIDV